MRESRNNIALRVCKIAVITHTEPLEKVRIAKIPTDGRPIFFNCEQGIHHFTVAIRAATVPLESALAGLLCDGPK